MEMVENGTISLAWFVTVVLIWAATIYQSHRLFRKFVAKYPDVASREIPYAFSHFAHPQKALFFWRRRSVELLRPDGELWKQRQCFVYLSVASLVVPFVGFGVLLLYAILHR